MATTPSQHPQARDRLEALRSLERGTTLDAALAFYDSLPAVSVEEMLGAWRGSGIDTSNPLDGLLESFGWHGKRFESADDAHPLVFDSGDGTLLSVNPSFIPMGFVVKHAALLRQPIVARAFTAIRGLLRTTKPHARLRLTEYRGVVSGTMSYDVLPINDVFRKIDSDTLIGAMDLRGMESPFLFALRREPPAPSPTQSADGNT